MSLINNMLQDLDQRGADRSGAKSSHEGLWSASSLAKGNGLWWPGIWFGVLVVAVVLTVGGWWFVEGELAPERRLGFEPPPETDLALHNQHPGEPLRLDTEEPAGVKPAQAGTPAQRVQGTDFRLSGSRVSDVQPIEPALSEPVATLLARARAARADDRLTVPAGDNAYDYYQQVLVMAPDNAEARAGLEAMVRRYRELVDSALDEGALERAQILMRRARSLDVGAESLQERAERLRQLEQTRASDTTVSTPGVEGEADTTPSSTEVKVNPDMASRDRRRAELARQLWQSGDRPGARAELERTLADFEHSDTPPVQSTLLLIELYLEAEQPGAAEALLERADYLPRVERVRLQALGLAHRGENRAALGLLESEQQQQAAREHEPYRALLARLYFAGDYHTQAAQAYRGLLTDFGEDPAYWLGLGLAEDAADNPEQAYRAFRRALGSGAYPRDGSVSRYLERRIQALARAHNAEDD